MSKVNETYGKVIGWEGTRLNQSTDEYKNLLTHMMLGSLYNDDIQFQNQYLFGETDIQTWIYLKMAGFKYAKENAGDSE